MMSDHLTTRRHFIVATGGLIAGAGIPARLAAEPASSSAARAEAAVARLEAAVRELVGESPVKAGKIKLDIPLLVENGNAVPLAVTVDSPMTEADHVKTIHIFNEKNPQPNVANFHLGPRAGRAHMTTRMRLADTQKVVAIAQLSDGSFWSDSVDVVVTLAACLED
jgi:sulfur-oxidizing protein SoxY